MLRCFIRCSGGVAHREAPQSRVARPAFLARQGVGDASLDGFRAASKAFVNVLMSYLLLLSSRYASPSSLLRASKRDARNLGNCRAASTKRETCAWRVSRAFWSGGSSWMPCSLVTRQCLLRKHPTSTDVSSSTSQMIGAPSSASPPYQASDVLSRRETRHLPSNDATHWLRPWKPSKANLSTTSCSGFVVIVLQISSTVGRTVMLVIDHQLGEPSAQHVDLLLQGCHRRSP